MPSVRMLWQFILYQFRNPYRRRLNAVTAESYAVMDAATLIFETLLRIEVKDPAWKMLRDAREHLKCRHSDLWREARNLRELFYSSSTWGTFKRLNNAVQ